MEKNSCRAGVMDEEEHENMKAEQGERLVTSAVKK